jgi:hypothetical protein
MDVQMSNGCPEEQVDMCALTDCKLNISHGHKVDYWETLYVLASHTYEQMQLAVNIDAYNFEQEASFFTALSTCYCRTVECVGIISI